LDFIPAANTTLQHCKLKGKKSFTKAGNLWQWFDMRPTLQRTCVPVLRTVQYMLNRERLTQIYVY
jgi:hypothetical protein